MTNAEAEQLRQGDKVRYSRDDCDARAYVVGTMGTFAGLSKNIIGMMLINIRMERPHMGIIGRFFPSECDLIEEAKKSPLQ